jgi:pimeloyl-ACP methyl ester carboxylesterase
MRLVLRGLLWLVLLLVAGAAGLAAAYYQPDIPRAELEAKYATPPSQFITLADGTRVHIRDQGNATGPAMMLLHGSNASLFTWEPLVKRLGTTYRIVTLDLPGHGLTGATPAGDYSQKAMADTAFGVADKLGLGRFILGGNSMGGGVSARMAAMAPDRISHLILLDAGGLPPKTPRERPWFFQLPATPVIREAMRWISPRFIFESGLRNAFYDKSLATEAMIDQYYAFNMMAGTREATLKRFASAPDPWLRENVSKITMPALNLWGKDDQILLTEAFAPLWAEAVPQSKLVILDQCGHIPMEEKPDETAKAITDFLAAAP